MPLNEMRFLLPLLSLALLGGWLLTGWVLLRRERLLQGRVDELLEQNRSQQLEMHQQLGAQLSLETRLEHLQESVARLDAERGRLATRLADAEGQCNEWQRSAERFQVQAQEQQRQGEQLQAERRTLEQRLQQLQQTHEQLRVEHSTLQTTLSQRQQHFDEQQQLLKDSREQLKLEFEQLAGRIFEAKGQTFTQTSQQSLDALLKPFREQIDQFRSKVEDIHHKDTQQQAALAQELLHLKQLNQQITQEAHDLSTALRGQKKTQGNWGELILENVLERSGLRAGIDFKREVSMTASDGQRQRPDALVYLPQDKHLIIDAKVSLNAYTRYINSEDDTERRLALAEHVQAFGQRIRELAERNYFDLPGLNAPEMVFMFVPIESAFVEALKADETLFQKAIEQNVLVATPTTLLTSLNIVRQLWRFEDQNRHTAELAERAARVHDKLRTFLGSMESIGSSLDKASEAYHKACAQLVSGRGNLVKQVNDFKELGVSVKAELGENWTDRAELELGHDVPAADTLG
ncbi:DNA recombination protein RmuC [Halopseudomonas bauzanensis]|uniref:DNA recombination protein RmuC n=1 Tax=Halopseudomonas bauzanensis TaxID=653930 RepID=A0A1I4IV06_9GAMM|nr:DNA recombination protein RmuC [Halopseudomonas bauzanensis]SER72020.1 DNA recombination protein RmuC [Halopseudomonas bauzanensis]SFL58134.1 DNA recombination protein RmuC [Halopseudomonas bauzanensis]